MVLHVDTLCQNLTFRPITLLYYYNTNTILILGTDAKVKPFFFFRYLNI